MRNILFSLLLCSMGLSPSTFAQTKATASFQNSSLSILKDLQSQGIKQVGEISVNDLISQVKQVRWLPINSALGGSGGARSTSIYLVEKKTVMVSEPLAGYTPEEMRPLMALHEGLGANGYDDENYRITMGLLLAARGGSENLALANESLRNIKIRTAEPLYKDRLSAKGGVTSVGGGGDWTALEAKQKVLDLILTNLDRDLFKTVMKANFEPSWDSESPAEVTVKEINGTLEVTVPSILWISAKTAGNEVVLKYIAETILGQVLLHEK